MADVWLLGLTVAFFALAFAFAAWLDRIWGSRTSWSWSFRSPCSSTSCTCWSGRSGS